MKNTRGSVPRRSAARRKAFAMNAGRHSAPIFVAVIGLHRSGSSCTAGVLHHLGVHLGGRLIGHEAAGGFEDLGLTLLCESAYPFPAISLHVPRSTLARGLRKHVQRTQYAAARRGTIAGGKFPHLCAMLNQLATICGRGLKIIHINRPLEESIASLQSRERGSQDEISADRLARLAEVQRWLWEQKTRELPRLDHITIKYDDLLSNPRREVDRVIRYLPIRPTEGQVMEAIGHVRPGLRRHRTTAEPERLTRVP